MTRSGKLKHGATYTDDGQYVTVSGNCVFSGEPYTVRVPSDNFYGWLNGGMFIQDAFPYIPAEDREFLLSGISPAGWEFMFPSDNE